MRRAVPGAMWTPGTHGDHHPPQDLDGLLENDHRRLEGLFDALLSAFKADAREDIGKIWAELDASLTAHMALEERLILPAFAKAAPGEAAALIDEHGQLRKRLLELGVCVDLHTMRAELGRSFINELRDHARREEDLLYRWWAGSNRDAYQAWDFLHRFRTLFPILTPLAPPK